MTYLPSFNENRRSTIWFKSLFFLGLSIYFAWLKQLGDRICCTAGLKGPFSNDDPFSWSNKITISHCKSQNFTLTIPEGTRKNSNILRELLVWHQALPILTNSSTHKSNQGKRVRITWVQSLNTAGEHPQLRVEDMTTRTPPLWVNGQLTTTTRQWS